MIQFDQKNDWAIDVQLHIPIPSISISITSSKKEAVPNEPLAFTAGAQESVTVDEQS